MPEELIADVLIDRRARFGAVSSETQTIKGVWQHEGQVFQDDLIRVFVDAPDGRGARQFFKSFKQRLKKQFKQIDVWLTTYPIEVL
ncbi:MAG: hypothetical protein ACT4QC_16885 [Planctomycetaceae bacterium]